MIYFAWMSNNTDHRDDEPIKIRANSIEEAQEYAVSQCRHRFTVRYVVPRNVFKDYEPWWHAHFWGHACDNDR